MASKGGSWANIFTSCFGACGGFFGSFGSSIRRWADGWRKRLTSKEECEAYVVAEWQKIAWIAIYYAVSIALFIEAFVRYAKLLPTLPWVWIARGFGQLLNFNCALVSLPVMRTILTILRTLKFGIVVPLDKNIVFHRYIAYNIAIFGVAHGIAHYFNYSFNWAVYALSEGPRNPTAVVSSPLQACWGTLYGLTGNILLFVMVIMYAAATKSYRQSNNFTIFWYTHHLFIVFYALLLLHGKNFWMWFFGPGVFYIIERILRNIRGSSHTVVKRVKLLPSRVVNLCLDKPSFKYKAGQYAFVNCPLISKHEWHPFTISSAPHEEHLTFHVRCVGDWTNALADLFIPSKKVSTIDINKETSPDGRSYLIRVDGPFGTCADFVWNFEYVMLVAAGIGVTPYSSLLKDIHYKLHHDKALRIKKVFFYWINRDEGSWEWFSELLNQLEDQDPEFFEINTFMTGGLKEEQIKQIIFSSDEFLSHTNTNQQKSADVKLLARALYSYEPQSSDELQLEENDTVVIEERDESGWWKGNNTRTKQSGLFPSNYVVMIDSVTKMKQSKNRHFGRPMWRDEYKKVQQQVSQREPGKNNSVGVFFCGPAVLSKELYRQALSANKNGAVKFRYHKENF